MGAIFTLRDDGSTAAGPRLATLTFDTPGKSANVFSREAIEELETLVEELGRRVDLEALLLTSAKPRIFIAGAELATAPEAADRLEDGVSRITAEMTDALDSEIDKYMARVDLPPKFVIPGGNQISAQLDLGRTILRRAERKVVSIQQAGELASPEIMRFLNRASDLCFAMARDADVDNPSLFEGRRKSS